MTDRTKIYQDKVEERFARLFPKEPDQRHLTRYLAQAWPIEASDALHHLPPLPAVPGNAPLTPPIEVIVTLIANGFGMDYDLIVSPVRSHDVSRVRAFIMHVLRSDLFAYSLADIGAILGGRDHTTIHYHVNQPLPLRKHAHTRFVLRDVAKLLGVDSAQVERSVLGETRRVA